MSDEIFPKKLANKLPSGYQDNTDGKTNDELLKEILKASHVQADTEKDMENDDKLLSLRDDLKILSGGYKDVIAEQNAKIKYCLFLLKSRGG